MLRFVAAAVVLLVASATAPAFAQDPRSMLLLSAASLQRGNLQPFGMQLQQTIFQQTGGTGIYQPLLQLGQPVNAVVASQVPVPNGLLFQGRVFHQNGYSDWTLGYSFMTGRIEYGNFNPVAVGWPSGGVPGTTGGVSGSPGGNPPTPNTGGPPSQPRIPSTQGDACARFPELC